MPLNFDEQAIMRGDVEQLNALFSATTAAPLTLRINTAEKFFARLFGREQTQSREQLDEAFVPLLIELKASFVTHASECDNFYCDIAHPLRHLFECLLSRASTWYARDSKTNQLFYEKLAAIIHLSSKWCETASTNASHITTETTALVKMLSEFQAWDDIEENRAALLESRLCESELNHLKMLTAESYVLDMINNALSGKKLPLSLHDTIPITLKNELLHCLHTAGIDSTFWKLWQRLLPLIGNVFTINEKEHDDQKMYREIPAMLNELERSILLESGHPDSYNYFIETLSHNLMLAVQKQLPECPRFKALAYPDGHNDMNTRVTDSVMQQAIAIQPGDWILFTNEDNRLIRCKLALKNADFDQLLFVDRSGRKVMIKSSKDFSVCLSTGIAKPLIKINSTDVITKLIQALITLQGNSPQTQPAQSEPTPMIDIKNSTGDEEKNIEIAKEVNLRRLAAHKAMAEARALADEKNQRDNDAKLTEQTRVEHQQAAQEAEKTQQAQFAQQFAQQQINALNVGAWVEIHSDTAPAQRCKLAVIIASAGKYIFVSNLGIKVAEYQREKLLELVLNQQLTLINNGDKFEDQLVKVIRSLRKDIN